MKVETNSPRKPDVAITLTWDEAVALRVMLGTLNTHKVIKESVYASDTTHAAVYELLHPLYKELLDLQRP